MDSSWFLKIWQKYATNVVKNEVMVNGKCLDEKIDQVDHLIELWHLNNLIIQKLI